MLGVAQGEASCRLLVRDRGAMDPVLRALLEAGAGFTGIRFDEPTLEDVFLLLTHTGLELGDE